MPTCKQSALISYIYFSLGLLQGVAEDLQSVQAPSLFFFLSLIIKYSFGVGRDEDSNFHLTYNYNHIKKH